MKSCRGTKLQKVITWVILNTVCYARMGPIFRIYIELNILMYYLPWKRDFKIKRCYRTAQRKKYCLYVNITNMTTIKSYTIVHVSENTTKMHPLSLTPFYMCKVTPQKTIIKLEPTAQHVSGNTTKRHPLSLTPFYMCKVTLQKDTH